MSDLWFTNEEIKLISDLINYESVEIIWDINAFYFNTDKSTFKLFCETDLPKGSDYEYDEIFYCRFEKVDEKIGFKSNDPKFWYKIISTDIKIDSVKVIDVVQVFPNDILISINELSEFEDGLNKLSLGLIIGTEKGLLPAFLLPSNHGFDWQTKYDFYSETEIKEVLEKNIKKFELRNLS